ncbi:PilZ domain-containing protein [Teredinibacter turnerae]|uniref:PilZ domain-containing protein n=1 Tax=Teredinibacter turnerae TaxID=2426 RepID=UPI0003FBE219|nr:PilZ domain-containing protein [Teredinibacter turnerae]
MFPDSEDDTSHASERRVENRLSARFHSSLRYNNQTAVAHVVNISEQGALIAVLNENRPGVGDSVTLDIDQMEQNIMSLAAVVAHTKEHLIGLTFTDPDELTQAALAEFVTGLDEEE